MLHGVNIDLLGQMNREKKWLQWDPRVKVV